MPPLTKEHFQLAHNAGYTRQQLAELFGVSVHAVDRARRRFKLPPREPGRPVHPKRQEILELYENSASSVPTLAAIYDVSANTIYRWRSDSKRS